MPTGIGTLCGPGGSYCGVKSCSCIYQLSGPSLHPIFFINAYWGHDRLARAVVFRSAFDPCAYPITSSVLEERGAEDFPLRMTIGVKSCLLYLGSDFTLVISLFPRAS